MSDSVDRVFSHALNTVNKIRTGSEKPPASIRLTLYGLYKQSMEGNVEGIMEMPKGTDEQSKRAREKWDAWHAQSSLSRTEAKRRYITTLIDTMHKYASHSPESRELVSELEFVWDQVKSNVPSSASSSPQRQFGILGNVSQHSAPPKYGGITSFSESFQEEQRLRNERRKSSDPIRLISPLSQSQEEELLEAEEDETEEFVDAPDSQMADPPPRMIDAEIASPLRNERRSPQNEDRPKARRKSSNGPSNDEKWRKRIESALVKMTAEVAALREQLESRRLFTHTLQYRILRFISNAVWGLVKHVALDVVILGVILLWMRRKKDKRLEGAMRVLLGDAVAQVQKVGEKQLIQLGKIHLPTIIGAGKSTAKPN
ncbi:acyl CoA binding protein-domain-containing protein [Venturia nashicola]|nr:acyl CoA binding protein-domain-containing protein [Venturia nashicola]